MIRRSKKKISQVIRRFSGGGTGKGTGKAIGKKHTRKVGMVKKHSKSKKKVVQTTAIGLDRITVVDDDGKSHHYPKRVIDIMGKSFNFDKTLGQGGFGHVLSYKSDSKVKDKRAVKFFRNENEMIMEKTNYEKLSRFPDIKRYIPTYYGSISKNETYHGIILEQLEFDLYSLEKNKSSLSFGKIYNLLAEIIHCLTAFHKAGICINDLKPENMMIKHEIHNGKKKPRLYIIDLCLTGANLPNSFHCHTNQFDPPHVKIDDNKCRPQNDIWNFGVICFIFLISGIEWKTLRRDYEGTLNDVVNNPYTKKEINSFITASQYTPKQKKWINTLFNGILNSNESQRWSASRSVRHFNNGKNLVGQKTSI